MTHLPAPTPPKRRGNPLGNPNLNLSPRCGARNRAGCACQAPAIRGKARCRFHGGHSTGPRTAEGLARLRAARTLHGGFGAEALARHRFDTSLLRRTRMLVELARWIDHLPTELAARVTEAPELSMPARPTRGLTPKEAKAMGRLEAAALAPWRRAAEAAKRAARGKPHEPVFRGSAETAARGDEGKPHVPVSDPRGGGGSAPREFATPESREKAHEPVFGAAAGEAARENEGRPYEPVSAAPIGGLCGGLDSAASHSEGEAGGPVLGGPASGAVGLGADAAPATGGKPHEPVFGQLAAPTSPRPAPPGAVGEAIGTPPAGLTRAQRKRWKWQQRKARKVLAGRG